MRRKVYLANPGTGTDRNLLPLSIGLIASYCRSLPELAAAYDIELLFLRGDPDAVAAEMDDPAVVGISCYSWHLNASMSLARAIKRRHPRCVIVAGGYSVPIWPERIARFAAAHPYVDVLVNGEGEIPFSNVLSALLAGSPLQEVPGLAVRVADPAVGFVSTGVSHQLVQLDDIPSPFLNGVFDEVMAKHGDRVTGTIWETTRGCPYRCTFCAWGKSDTSKIRQVNTERLYAEIDWMARNKIPYVYAADANFGIFYQRDLAIAQKLADTSRETGFPKYLAWNWAKHSGERVMHIGSVLRDAGIRADITLSIQSFNDPTLAAIKRKNIPIDEFRRLKTRFQQERVPTYTELILGLPLETEESFRLGVERAMTSYLTDKFWVHICMLLDNSEMSDPAYVEKYALETRICRLDMLRCVPREDEVAEDVEKEELVVSTSTLPLEAWKKSYVFAFMTIAMHSMRLAFFVSEFLHRETGRPRREFIDFLIHAAEQQPARYPQLRSGYDRLTWQRQQILDGKASLVPIVEAEGRMLGPSEAAVIQLASDPDAFFGELRELAGAFLQKFGPGLPVELVDDVVAYQRARFPVWPGPSVTRVGFRYAVASYFDELCTGGSPSTPTRHTESIELQVPSWLPRDPMRFALDRVVGGHTIRLYEVTVERDRARRLVPTLAVQSEAAHG